MSIKYTNDLLFQRSNINLLMFPKSFKTFEIKNDLKTGYVNTQKIK